MKLFIKILGLAALVAILPMFQSCDNINIKGREKPVVQGNGDFYAGKTSTFTYFDEAVPCASTGNSGRPFPNRQIQYNGATNTVYLVRDRCQDLEPVVIPPGDYVLHREAGTVTYQGQVFELQQDFADQDIVPHDCPAPLSPIPGAAPQNLLAGSNYALSSPLWTEHAGIDSGLFGTIEALPRYQVRRDNASYLDFYRRLSQYVPLVAGTRYAVSFLVSQGNTDSASVIYWDTDAYEFAAHVDFATGQAYVTYEAGFTPGSVTAQAVPYGAGYNLTLFFEIPSTVMPAPEIGVAPTNYSPTFNPEAGQVGDYVNATAAGIRRVADYCN